MAYIQGAGGSAEATSIAVAYPGDVTATNLLVVAVAVYSKTPAVADLTDSLGNTWTLENVLYIGSPGLCGLGIYTAVANGTGACTVTFNDADSAATDPLTLAVAEWSGLAQSPGGKASAIENASGSTNVHHGNVEQVGSGAYVGVVAQITGNVACTPDGAWDATIYDNDLGGTYPGLCMTYRLASAGTYNDGWTYAAGVYWIAMGVTFSNVGDSPSALPVLARHYRQRRS